MPRASVAYAGILAALYERERTGNGTTLEVSLFDALGEWISHPAYVAAYGSAQPARTGASHATIAPYGPFRTGGGSQINLAIQNQREWAAFCAPRPAPPQSLKPTSNGTPWLALVQVRDIRPKFLQYYRNPW
jgi:itaconate CoA-transferase